MITALDDLAALLLADYAVRGRRSLPQLKIAVRHLTRFLDGTRPAEQIGTTDVMRYVEHRMAAGIATGTISRELACLRRMYSLGQRSGLICRAPYIPAIPSSRPRTGFVEPAELEALINALPDYLRPPTRFAALTGWRKSEVFGLRWERVSFSDGTVRLEGGETKNGTGRAFPFSALPPLEAILRDQYTATRALERERACVIPWVFHRRGRQIRSFSWAWRTACRRVGIPHLLFHDLRRSAVRNLERAGVPRSVAMQLTGHKTESVYRRYAIVDDRLLAEGVGRLAAFWERHRGRACQLPLYTSNVTRVGPDATVTRQRGVAP